MKTLILSYVLVVTVVALAQPPDTLWTRTFGGSGSEGASSSQQTSEGGYIITGETHSYGAGEGDIWLIKTDASGDSLWSRTFGGSYRDGSCSVHQTTDSGFIIAGYTHSYGAGSADIWLIKTDANGDLLWSRTFGGSNYDKGYSVQQTTDGGYIIAGNTWSYGADSADVWLIKTDANGDSLWSRTFGGIYQDGCYSVQQTTDSGYVLTGYTGSYGAGAWDVWLIKTDANGDSLWSRTFGEIYDDRGFSVQQTIDGGYIIVGFSTWYAALAGADVWLIKTDANGDSLWSRTFGGIRADRGSSVRQTSDGGYIIAGSTEDYVLGHRVWIIKTDALGYFQWDWIFVGGSNWDIARSVQQTTDGGYFISAGADSFGAGDGDVWLIRLDSETSVEIDPKLYHPSEFILLTPYPNPFNPNTRLSYILPVTGMVNLSVYNITGRLVTTLVNNWQVGGIHEITFDGSGLASGIYLARIQAGDFSQIKKMILIK